MRVRGDDEDEQRTIWLDLYDVRDDGNRDEMMDLLIAIAIRRIGFSNLREIIASEGFKV